MHRARHPLAYGLRSVMQRRAVVTPSSDAEHVINRPQGRRTKAARSTGEAPDMPFVGTGHIWILAILLVVVLIIWGPGKLPDVGSGMGRAIREFRKASSDTREEFAKATRLDSADSASPAAPASAAPERAADHAAPR
ncbi:MAG: twin-arginine translocase TatA/TatE family subunit [Candidatus Dormibacter sp.]